MPLLTPRPSFRPFEYQWAFDAYLLQQQSHWLATEVPMTEDVRDYRALTPEAKSLLTQVLRFFTQGDLEVSNNYQNRLMPVFQIPEIGMMLSSFAASEAIHVHAYSYLIDTLGLPETEYNEFLLYDSMRKKYEYLHGFKSDSLDDLAKTLAVFGAFMEGTALFASFAILLNFQRAGINKMRGLGQIVAWSQRDESLHSHSISLLYKALVAENPSLQTVEHRESIYAACRDVVKMEDAFIDTCFSMGAVEGLKPEDVKAYVRYIADLRLRGLDLKPIYDIQKNPLPWVEDALSGKEFQGFFEGRVTEYSKGAIDETWPTKETAGETD